MDTSSEAATTDKLGRRNGPRRQYTLSEKRAIAEETLQRSASVAVVAQRHGINANLVFGWRRLFKQGLLSGALPQKAVTLLPVKVGTPTVLPSRRVVAAGASESARGGLIEIQFAGGRLLRVHGRVDHATLSYLIRTLSR